MGWCETCVQSFQCLGVAQLEDSWLKVREWNRKKFEMASEKMR